MGKLSRPSTVRVMVRPSSPERAPDIEGGFQMLLRPVPLLGHIGYVARGPVLATHDKALLQTVIQQLLHTVKTKRVIFLKAQPAYWDDWIAAQLPRHGFRPSTSHADNVATVLVDLTQPEDTLLARMNKGLRKSIRRAERKGVVVRQAHTAEFDTFYQILHQTSVRGHFAIHSQAYYRHVWEVFDTHHHAALFLAECEHEPVAAVFLIAFGDTVFARFGGWNGKYSSHEPNALLRWTAIRWAKQQGYHWYDFMGIDEHVARKLLFQPETVTRADIGGYTAFKLDFGGDVTLSPATYDYAPNHLLQGGLAWLQTHKSLYARILNMMRGVQS